MERSGCNVFAHAGRILHVQEFAKAAKNAAAMAAMEKALQRSQKLEAVGRLTGGMAHDFNNIL